MANSSKRQRRLWDTYTFPGFRPRPTVRGVFGEPKARIITLARRAKKRSAGAAHYSISPSARQVRIEIVAPGHRRYRRPALVRLRYDLPLLVFREYQPAAFSGGTRSRN